MKESVLCADGAKVRELREERGWTRRDLAKEVGCAEQIIENVEKGRPLAPRLLIEIEDALHVERWSLRHYGVQTVSDEDTAEVVDKPEAPSEEFDRRRIHVQFRVMHGRPIGKRLEFPAGREFVFGRGRECDVRANSEWVSWQHCLLRVEEDCAFLRDLGSRNGTLVNGERLVGERPLQPHDQVQVGPLVFEVEFVEAGNSPTFPAK